MLDSRVKAYAHLRENLAFTHNVSVSGPTGEQLRTLWAKEEHVPATRPGTFARFDSDYPTSGREPVPAAMSRSSTSGLVVFSARRFGLPSPW